MEHIKHLTILLLLAGLVLLHFTKLSHGAEEVNIQKANSVFNINAKLLKHNSSHENMSSSLPTQYNEMELRGKDISVLGGDMARILPRGISPQMSEGRSTNIVFKKRLWKRKNKWPEYPYFYNASLKADKNLFEQALKRWTDNTCMIAKKLPNEKCSDWAHLEAGVCITTNAGGCYYTGQGDMKQMSKPSSSAQTIELDENCNLGQMAHLIGHTFGMGHHFSRGDRDEFIHVNQENIGVDVFNKRHRDSTLSIEYSGLANCKNSAFQDLEMVLPFDYMSVLTDATASHTDLDSRVVFVTKDPSAQYMLDYHKEAGMVETFYDHYALNMGYGCVKSWVDDCKKNGKSPPKCKNLGYVGKNCKCLCPQAFTGDQCQTQKPWSKETRSLFPLLPNAFIERISDPKNLDLSAAKLTTSIVEGASNVDFKFYLFFTILIEAKPTDQVALNIQQNVGSKVKHPECSSKIINYIHENDCKSGITLYWGLAKSGHYRTECVSSLANNEADGPMFRSPTNKMNLVYMSRIGKVCNDATITEDLAKLKANVTFHKDAGKETGFTAGEKMTGAGGSGTLVGIIVGSLAGTLCCCCCCFLAWKRRQQQEEQEDENDNESSESGQEES